MSVNLQVTESLVGAAPLSAPSELGALQKRVGQAIAEAMSALSRQYGKKSAEGRIWYVKDLPSREGLVFSPIAALPEKFFQQGAGGLRKKDNVSFSEALRSVMEGPAHVAMDCLLAMQFCRSYALLKLLGDHRFNTFMALHPDLSDCIEMMPCEDLSEIRLGDCVYFEGVLDYPNKHPEGSDRGYNAVCVAEGKNPLFDAHGFWRPLTAAGIVALCEVAYSEPSKNPHWTAPLNASNQAQGWDYLVTRFKSDALFALQALLLEKPL